jgi:hypothetical protein
LKNRYRVEDADMRVLSLQNRLQDFDLYQERQQTVDTMEEMRFEWRESDIQTSMARASTQWGWQEADFAQNRQQFETQLGWQMEDFQEAIRFASGRERRRLIEQRERAVVQAGSASERWFRPAGNAGRWPRPSSKPRFNTSGARRIVRKRSIACKKNMGCARSFNK